MKFAEPPTFDHRDRQDIYEYVERHGRVSRQELRNVLGFDDRRFGHQLAILKRDGILEEVKGDLQIAFEDGTEETYESRDLEFHIRPARQADLTGLVGVMRQVVEKGSYVVAETVADIIDHERVLLRHNELESRMFFVATIDGEVVGWVHIDAPELSKLDHTAELTVGVLAEYRGNGIGSHLLERGVEWAATNGYERLYNSVPATNDAAVEFLQTNGWEVEAVRDEHYKIDGEYVDEVMLARTVG